MLAPVAQTIETAKFDLSLVFWDDAELTGGLTGSTDLFHAETLAGWATRFRRVVAAAMAEPTLRLSEWPLLEANEITEFLARGAGRMRRGAETSLIDAFSASVARHADAPAVVANGETLSYRELDRASNRLARHLAAIGVRTGERVAIALPRSIAQVVATVAIVKCGAAYLPLDAGHPLERRRLMLADAGCRVLLTARNGSDDADLAVSPAAAEVCGNGVDKVLRTPMVDGSHLGYLSPEGSPFRILCATTFCKALHKYGLRCLVGLRMECHREKSEVEFHEKN